MRLAEGEKSTFQQASDGASNAAGQAKDALGLGDSKSMMNPPLGVNLLTDHLAEK